MNFMVFFVLVVAARTYAETSEEGDAVLNLTTSNFTTALKENEFVLVEFFAPWCGHCRILDPAYSKAAKQLRDEGSAIKLAKVNAIEEVELANTFEITGYPTLTFFTNGVPVEYSGGYQAEEIVIWLKKKSGPPARPLKDKESVDAFKSESEIAVIGFFKDQESDKAKEYLKVARNLDDVLFGITSDNNSFAEYKLEDDSIVLFKQFDEGRNDFEGEFNETNIKHFIFLNRLPIVVEFNRHTVSKIFNDGPVKKQVVLFSKKEESDAFIKEVSGVAKDYKGQFLFVYVDTQEYENDHVLEFFGLKNDTPPVVRMFLVNENYTKYQPQSEGVDASAVQQFLADFLAGQLKPLYLSEEIPEGWDSQPVKVLVGQNFKDVAFNKDKAVFVKFYAPWCEHSKNLEPVWNQLGEAYKDNDKIVIAKIDASANEIEDLRISSYPSLKYFPSGSDQIIDYTGKRTLEAFKTFLDSDGKETVEEVEENEDRQDEEKADEKEQGEREGQETEETTEKKEEEDAREKQEEQEEATKEEAEKKDKNVPEEDKEDQKDDEEKNQEEGEEDQKKKQDKTKVEL